MECQYIHVPNISGAPWSPSPAPSGRQGQLDSPFIAGINARSKIFPTSTSKRLTCRGRRRINPGHGLLRCQELLEACSAAQEEVAELPWGIWELLCLQNHGAGQPQGAAGLPAPHTAGRLRPRARQAVVTPRLMVGRRGRARGGPVPPVGHPARDLWWLTLRPQWCCGRPLGPAQPPRASGKAPIVCSAEWAGLASLHKAARMYV